MKKDAQVVMIILWILVILSISAISIAHRVSMALRMGKYQRDSLKALYLAKAGINRAIVEIKKDPTQDYDTPEESWAANATIFKNITLMQGGPDFATVGYEVFDVYNNAQIHYGCQDEESKININNAPEALLTKLFTQGANLAVDQARSIAHDIVIWRGGNNTDDSRYGDFKKAPFSNPEELAVVLEHFYENQGNTEYRNATQKIFSDIRNLITAFPLNTTSKINANTAPKDVLKILALSLANPDEEGWASGVADDIDGQRTRGYFTKTSDITPSPDYEDFFRRVTDKLDVKSNFFTIVSTGYSQKTHRRYTVVYDRQGSKIIYWHEN